MMAMTPPMWKDIAGSSPSSRRQASSSLKLWLEANNGDWEDIIKMVEGAQLNRRQVQLLDRMQRKEAKDGYGAR